MSKKIRLVMARVNNTNQAKIVYITHFWFNLKVMKGTADYVKRSSKLFRKGPKSDFFLQIKSSVEILISHK